MTIKKISITETKNEEVERAYLTLTHATEVVNSFFNTYKQLRTGKRGRRLANEEQDLLRAMLVFASSGLDATVKFLIKDCLELVIHSDKSASDILENYALKKLKSGDLGDTTDKKFLASLLVSESPRKKVIDILVKELVSKSLQSVEEILLVGNSFAIKAEKLIKDINQTKEVFKTRNQIIHELDMILESDEQHSYYRNKSDMITYTNRLLSVIENFIIAVDEKISECKE